MGVRLGRSGCMFLGIPNPGDNHGIDKNPLFTAFPHSAKIYPYYGRFAFQSLLWGFLLKRLFALFCRNNGILWLFQKSCAGICNVFATWYEKVSRKSQSGHISGSAWRWMPDVKCTDHWLIHNHISEVIQSSPRPPSWHKTAFGIPK